MLNSTVPQSFGFRNRIIDGAFTHNQRGYVSGTALASGAYGHDRWKGGSGGGTYTFTQAAVGVPTTITITAGTLIQVIEGCNLPEGGTYTLSWSGTAQGRVASGSYAASPITVTGITAGTNLNIEFSTGTVGTVQFEPGSVATSYEYRAHGQELILCQRYYETGSTRYRIDPFPAGVFGIDIFYKVTKRAAATATVTAIFGAFTDVVSNTGDLFINFTSGVSGNVAANWTASAEL